MTKKNGLIYLLTLTLLLVLPVFTGCTLNQNADDDDDDSSSIDVLNTLDSLGFVTDPTKINDQSSDLLSKTYHPLRKKTAVYNKINEIYAAGVEYHQIEAYKNRKQVLLNDISTAYNVLHSDYNKTWNEMPLHTTAGDIDGDGFEEVVILYVVATGLSSVFMRIIDDKSMDYQESDDIIITSSPIAMGHYRELDDFNYKIDAACGDFDGDGNEEIAAAVGGSLLVIDDKDHDYALIYNEEYWDSGFNAELSIAHVAAGDLNEDGKDEIVYTHGYDDYPNFTFRILSMDESDAWITLKDQYSDPTFVTYQFANVTIGDVDGDRHNEIIFAGDVTSNTNDYLLLIMNDFTTDFSFYNIVDNAQRDKGTWSDHKTVALEVFRPEGLPEAPASEELPGEFVPQEAILAYRSVLRFYPNTQTILEEKEIDAYDKDLAVVGDVTGNGRDDVIIQRGGDMYIIGQNDELEWQRMGTIDCDRKYYSSICVVNCDDDSEVLQYTGDHEVMFPEPEILAVLASPPYFSHYDQNMTAYATTFGQTTESATTQSHKAGLDVGFSIGASAEFPLLGSTVASFESKYYLNMSFDFTTSSMTSISRTRSFSSPAGEDTVIIMCIPFDVYYYTIVSSPSPEAVGETISINIPKTIQTIPMERNYYNQVMENAGLTQYRIDNTILSHTIGDASTYPDTSTKISYSTEGSSSYKKNFVCSESAQVISHGNSAYTEEIVLSEAVSYGGEFTIEAGNETNFTAGGLAIGFNIGMHYGYSYEVTMTQSTKIEGGLVMIPDETYTSEDEYLIGLMGYTDALKNGKEFFVVNYWYSEN